MQEGHASVCAVCPQHTRCYRYYICLCKNLWCKSPPHGDSHVGTTTDSYDRLPVTWVIKCQQSSVALALQPCLHTHRLINQDTMVAKTYIFLLATRRIGSNRALSTLDVPMRLAITWVRRSVGMSTPRVLGVNSTDRGVTLLTRITVCCSPVGKS